MASMSATLTEFADNGNSRTYTASGHTAIKPRNVVERRTVPVGNQIMAGFSGLVTYGVNDSEGGVAPQRVSMEANVRYPVVGIDASDLSTVRDAVLVLFRDFVNSDEFTAAVASLNWVE